MTLPGASFGRHRRDLPLTDVVLPPLLCYILQAHPLELLCFTILSNDNSKRIRKQANNEARVYSGRTVLLFTLMAALMTLEG